MKGRLMYREDCCWNNIRDRCIGQECECECHMPISHLVTPEGMILEAQRELYRLYETEDMIEALRLLQIILNKILLAKLIEKRI